MADSKQTQDSNKGAMTQLDLMSKNKKIQTVKYKDMQGNENNLQITMKDPGDFYRIQAMDMIKSANDTADFVSLYQLIMDRVLISPRFSYKYENKQLKQEDKDFKHHEITATNKDDDEIHLIVNVPDYQTIVKLLFMSTRPSAASNLTGLVEALEDDVWTDKEKQKITNDFWNYGQPGDGFIMDAINETITYLSKIVDRNGFLSVMNAGVTFLTKRS